MKQTLTQNCSEWNNDACHALPACPPLRRASHHSFTQTRQTTSKPKGSTLPPHSDAVFRSLITWDSPVCATHSFRTMPMCPHRTLLAPLRPSDMIDDAFKRLHTQHLQLQRTLSSTLWSNTLFALFFYTGRCAFDIRMKHGQGRWRPSRRRLRITLRSRWRSHHEQNIITSLTRRTTWTSSRHCSIKTFTRRTTWTALTVYEQFAASPVL